MNHDAESDDSLFRRAMSGTNRQRKVYQQKKLTPDDKPKPQARLVIRNQVNAQGQHTIRPPADIAIDDTDCSNEVFFARSGMQHNVLRRLKQGRYGWQQELDLHGLHRVQAESELNRFIDYCWRDQTRYLLIIHGKGLRSSSGSILKTLTIQWLRDCPHVLAFCSAQGADGGSGALYVMLRQNKEQL